MKKNKPIFPKPFLTGLTLRVTGSATMSARGLFRLLFLTCLAVLAFATRVNAQTITLSGVVTEVSGAPMPGVNVFIKGTPSAGTITTTDGSYTLKGVPAVAILSFSFIGFKTQEVGVAGKTRIDIQLEENITAFPEIVVSAGYYSVKERERTGSISKISAKDIENQPVSNVLSAVQGQLSGVNIIQGSGVPGSSYNIQIRGINSLRSTGNYPMYIIDGVPVSAETRSALSGTIMPLAEFNPLSSINPNNIESIEILKDADATAIYGSRGGNGVILITTKKGKPGSKTSFNINSSYGLSKVASKMKLMNTEQYLGMRRQAYANDGITTYPANAYDINGAWDQTRNTDWQEKLIGRTAVNSNVQFSVSGGSENTSFLISGSHNKQTTVFANEFMYKSNNISGNLSHRSGDKRFMLNASMMFSEQSNNLIQTDITSKTLLLSPVAPALSKEDGSLNWENNTFTNPVAAYECTYNYKNKTYNTDINLQYEIFHSFFLKLNGGMNYVTFADQSLYPNSMYNPSNGITTANSMAYKGENQQFTYILEPQAHYKFNIGDHHLDILFGGTYQQRQDASLIVFGYGFASNALLTNLAAANTIAIDNDEETGYNYAAIFGRINYQYKDRYILNLTGRRDGSSRFGPDKQFADFGAVGAAWLFSEENIIKNAKWLSYGKLRASFGITGSDLIGDYQYLDTYTVSSTLYGGKTGLYPSRLFNPYFSWEKTTKLEVALETGFIDDLIHLTAAWYRNRSGNQLVGIQLPGTTGFSSIQANLPATVENSGLELELNTIPVKTTQFRWRSNVNISFPRNKLISFPGLEGSTYSDTYVVGHSTSIVKVYNYTGIDPKTGLHTFTDYNADGSISTPEDNLIIKEVGIKFFGGWYNQFSYNHWEFSFLIQFVNQQQWNYNSLMARPGSMNNQPTEVLNVWSEDNPEGKYMPYTSGLNSQKKNLFTYYKNSTAAIGDAAFIRLKNIQLSYMLPLNKYIKDMKVFVQGQNVLTLTNYFGLDPEFTTTGFLPPLKIWSFGFQFNF